MRLMVDNKVELCSGHTTNSSGQCVYTINFMIRKRGQILINLGHAVRIQQTLCSKW